MVEAKKDPKEIPINPVITSFPELQKLKGTVENNAWHDNDNVFTHTVAVFNKTLEALSFSFIGNGERRRQLQNYFHQPVARLPYIYGSFFTTKGDVLLFATAFHDIAKPQTFTINSDGKTACPNHEALGADISKEILIRNGFQKEVVQRAAAIIVNHAKPHMILNPAFTEEKRAEELAKFREEHPDIYLDLLIHAMADTQGSQLAEKNPEEYAFRIGEYHRLINAF